MESTSIAVEEDWEKEYAEKARSQHTEPTIAVLEEYRNKECEKAREQLHSVQQKEYKRATELSTQATSEHLEANGCEEQKRNQIRKVTAYQNKEDENANVATPMVKKWQVEQGDALTSKCILNSTKENGVAQRSSMETTNTGRSVKKAQMRESEQNKFWRTQDAENADEKKKSLFRAYNNSRENKRERRHHPFEQNYLPSNRPVRDNKVERSKNTRWHHVQTEQYNGNSNDIGQLQKHEGVPSAMQSHQYKRTGEQEKGQETGEPIHSQLGRKSLSPSQDPRKTQQHILSSSLGANSSYQSLEQDIPQVTLPPVLGLNSSCDPCEYDMLQNTLPYSAKQSSSYVPSQNATPSQIMLSFPQVRSSDEAEEPEEPFPSFSRRRSSYTPSPSYTPSQQPMLHETPSPPPALWSRFRPYSLHQQGLQINDFSSSRHNNFDQNLYSNWPYMPDVRKRPPPVGNPQLNLQPLMKTNFVPQNNKSSACIQESADCPTKIHHGISHNVPPDLVHSFYQHADHLLVDDEKARTYWKNNTSFSPEIAQRSTYGNPSCRRMPPGIPHPQYRPQNLCSNTLQESSIGRMCCAEKAGVNSSEEQERLLRDYASTDRCFYAGIESLLKNHFPEAIAQSGTDDASRHLQQEMLKQSLLQLQALSHAAAKPISKDALECDLDLKYAMQTNTLDDKQECRDLHFVNKHSEFQEQELVEGSFPNLASTAKKISKMESRRGACTVGHGVEPALYPGSMSILDKISMPLGDTYKNRLLVSGKSDPIVQNYMENSNRNSDFPVHSTSIPSSHSSSTVSSNVQKATAQKIPYQEHPYFLSQHLRNDAIVRQFLESNQHFSYGNTESLCENVLPETPVEVTTRTLDKRSHLPLPSTLGTANMDITAQCTEPYSFHTAPSTSSADYLHKTDRIKREQNKESVTNGLLKTEESFTGALSVPADIYGHRLSSMNMKVEAKSVPGVLGHHNTSCCVHPPPTIQSNKQMGINTNSLNFSVEERISLNRGARRSPLGFCRTSRQHESCESRNTKFGEREPEEKARVIRTPNSLHSLVSYKSDSSEEDDTVKQPQVGSSNSERLSPLARRSLAKSQPHFLKANLTEEKFSDSDGEIEAVEQSESEKLQPVVASADAKKWQHMSGNMVTPSSKESATQQWLCGKQQTLARSIPVHTTSVSSVGSSTVQKVTQWKPSYPTVFKDNVHQMTPPSKLNKSASFSEICYGYTPPSISGQCSTSPNTRRRWNDLNSTIGGYQIMPPCEAMDTEMMEMAAAQVIKFII